MIHIRLVLWVCRAPRLADMEMDATGLYVPLHIPPRLHGPFVGQGCGHLKLELSFLVVEAALRALMKRPMGSMLVRPWRLLRVNLGHGVGFLDSGGRYGGSRPSVTWPIA